MDNIASLIRPVLESESKNETLGRLLMSCVDQQAFSKGKFGTSSLVGEINAKLNASVSRHEGLLLLQAFLPQCSEDVLSRHGHLWMQSCLKATSDNKTSLLSFTVLTLLVKLSVAVPDAAKHVSSTVVANFAERVHGGIPSQAYLGALQCLEQCMVNFNGPCGPHRKVFERFLHATLDYTGRQEQEIVWQVACCVALLPQIGGGGVGGVQYRCAWAAQQKILCRTAHLILDELYDNSYELQLSLMGGKLEGTDHLPLPPINDDDPVSGCQKLTARLSAVLNCLQAMLVMPFPVPKNVSASSVMGLICRGLTVNGHSLGVHNTNHCLALAASLPMIHFVLLKTLEALIKLGGVNMLPYAEVICKLVIQTLKWTQEESNHGSAKPFCFLRLQAYDVMKIWCGIAKLGSSIADHAQQYIDLSLSDIYSEKDSISLSGGPIKRNKMGPRKQSKQTGSRVNCNMGLSLSTLSHSDTANEKVCVGALQAMSAVIMAASSRIEASLHKTLQETVVTILLKVSNTSSEIPIPYSLPTPRLELYRLLLQLVLDGHTVWPAPTNVALTLFSNGLNDSDVQVSMFCGTALSCVEKIIHPAYASLYVQSSVADESTGIGESPMFRLQSPPGAASANRAVDDDNDLEIIDAETENLHNEQRENRQEEQRRSVGGSQPLQLSAVAGPSDNPVTTPRMTSRFSLRSTTPHQPSPVKTVTEKERETDSEEPNELNETNNSGICNRDTGNITPSKVILKRFPVSTDKQHSVVSRSVVSRSEKISEPEEMPAERSVRTKGPLTRAQKAKEKGSTGILFSTYAFNTQVKSSVQELGGNVVDSIDEAHILVMDELHRTIKVLCAIGRGLPICSTKWITLSKEAGKLLDPWDHLLKDPEGEKKHNINLKESLKRASKKQLLQGHTIFVTPSTQPEPAKLSKIVSCCGGEALLKPPTNWRNVTCIVSCEDDEAGCSVFKNESQIVSVEWLLSGVMRQELKLP